jgi:hypothetical protein
LSEEEIQQELKATEKCYTAWDVSSTGECYCPERKTTSTCLALPWADLEAKMRKEGAALAIIRNMPCSTEDSSRRVSSSLLCNYCV